MSDRTDNSGINNHLLVSVGVAVIVLAVGVGAYFGWRLSGGGASQQPPLQGLPSSAQLLRSDVPLTVTLCYPVNSLLSAESAAVKRQPDTQSQARETLTVLLRDQRASLTAVLKDIKPQELYLDASGTAYVDLIANQQKEVTASTGDELLALYAVVNTLTLNFEEIKQVSFLLDGREARTLAGHVDLSGRFTKRMDLVRQ